MYNTIMRTNRKNGALFILIFISNFYSSNGCWMEGVNSWIVGTSTNINDTFRGNVYDRATRDIESITSYTFIDGLNGGPYFTVSLEDSRFIIATNDAFEDYEEYETLEELSVTLVFRCSGGSAGILTFLIQVQDTNNNAPRFLPSNDFAYTITTPVAPGFLVTECSGITVRDIDLTTQRIDFDIEDNPYFDIEYNGDLLSDVKEFKGILRTKTFIRSLPEPITLQITATDVDLTGDPRQSTTGYITFRSNPEFDFPDEPVFSQAFYLADYNDDELVFNETIYLQSGYDEQVIFSLEETEFSHHFEAVPIENRVSIRVVEELPTNVLRENQILLVVRADREYTSGATATIVVQQPEVVSLEFEKPHYEGTIVDNDLRAPELTLTQGYEGETVHVDVLGEHGTYFNGNAQGNTITLSTENLPQSIINENNVISLEIVASTEFSTARAIVTLEIIKDDNVTPVFNKAVYAGSYTTETGLTIEPIVLNQGYEEPIDLYFDEDEFSLFTVRHDGPIVTVTAERIPPEMFYQERIVLILRAPKSRTVGATAIIDITLPAARELGFQENTYRGTLQDNNLNLYPVVLSTGYDETVEFSISGELEEHFDYIKDQDRITLILNPALPIPPNIIQENNLIILYVEAFGPHAVTTTTTILLDIIKEDNITPIFAKNIYYGLYEGVSSFSIEHIDLSQGFNTDVRFELQGEYSDYFRVTNDGPNIEVSVQSEIPADLIFREKVLPFNIVATKPLTVGANAAILIRFPSELTDPVVMRFAQNTYEATVENDILTVDDIILSEGYAIGTQFLLTEGDYSKHFNLTDIENGITLTLIDPLPIDEIENSFIVLDLEARRESAVSVWTSIVIDIVRQEIEPLVFSQPFYQGIYTAETGQLSVETISLARGHDGTVTFDLEGELAPLFTLTGPPNAQTIVPKDPLSDEVLGSNSHLLLVVRATKPNAVETRATISITIEREQTENTILSFDRFAYTGILDSNMLDVEPITLVQGFTTTVSLTLHGALEDYFTATWQGVGGVSVTLSREIPDELLPANRIIVLQIQASEERALPAYATIVIEVVADVDQPSAPRLAFDASYYTGTYTSGLIGLVMDNPIILAEGSDATVEFDVEGEDSHWFVATGSGDYVTLSVREPIPAGVLVRNQPLVFVLTAARPGSETARAAIVISLPDEQLEDEVLAFNSITYIGSLENGVLNVEPITLVKGFTTTVSLTLHGALEDYFTATWQGVGGVSVTLSREIPDELLPANRIIVLQIQASEERALPAYATIVIEVVADVDQPSAPRLAFDASYYTGTYTSGLIGLVMDNPIILAEGSDATVEFDVEGEDSHWFVATGSGDYVTLSVREPIPAGVLVRNQPLVFVFTAARPGSETARATIVISLPDEQLEDEVLAFNSITYIGSLENGVLNVEPITLVKGFTTTVSLTLHGALEDYFTATWQGVGGVSVTLSREIPDELLPANRIIVLQIQASEERALPAYATIVIEVVADVDQPSAPRLAFDASYYTGTYTSGLIGLVMDNPIILAEGSDATVEFDVEGEDSHWFVATGSGDYVTLTVREPIPAGVLVRNQPLVFVLTAARPGSETARATIVISLPDEQLEDEVLAFNSITYIGSLENGVLNVEPITLVKGFTTTVSLTLHGALEDYFTATWQGVGGVSVTLSREIPDELLPANRIIVLQIQASEERALPAYATIVIEVVADVDQPSAPRLAFDASYYTGTYTSGLIGLVMDNPIILAEGSDATVEFDVEGEDSHWFVATGSGDYVTLSVREPIPAGVLVRNQPLVFVLTAARPGSETARAAIVISLPDEQLEDEVLAFNSITYIGSLENGVLNVEPITLVKGFTTTVSLTLHGALEDYFTATWQGVGGVSVTLSREIPDELLPANRIIVLQIQASEERALPAYATIVIEVVADVDQPSAPRLAFDASYYTGTYTSGLIGLVMDNPIILAEGSDATVEFDVEGEDSHWFVATGSGDYVMLSVREPIPAGVLVRNQPLVFVLTAARPGSETARAAIVISLPDEQLEDEVLAFNSITYIGSLENGVLNVEPITLVKGFTTTVSLTLHGALEDYFTATWQGVGGVSVTLSREIPDELLPANRIIVLQIQASEERALPAYATIVIEVVADVDQPSAPRLAFDASYYTGTYTSGLIGLVMDNPIILAEGSDATVEFDVEGEDSHWFVATGSGDYVTLSVREPIPAGVLVRNQPLVFVLTAARPGSETARAAIVISLPDEQLEDEVLAFNSITYIGSLENGVLNVEPITLVKGFTTTVSLTLHGALEDYFTATWQGVGGVSVTLSREIPDELLPANRIIVLQIQASEERALPAYATIVIEVVADVDQPSAPRLAFDASYYTGTYTSGLIGLVMDNPIILAEGSDATVEFDVEGEDSHWFVATGSGDYVTLSVREPIPAGVLVRNQPLVFVLTAARPGSETARAAIVISLPDEQLEDEVLAFNSITYIGSLENGVLNVEPITLVKGFTTTVSLTLHGALEDYFTATWQGVGGVSVTLSREIPDELLPANRIIVLQIQASEERALPAYATIVIEVVADVDQPSAPRLAFDASYYTGTYTSGLIGLVMDNPIILAEGSDATVEFDVEGEDSHWFVATGSGDYVTLTVREPIPDDVLFGNHVLIFVLTANRLGSDTGRATIIISLNNDSQIGDDVSFDKLVYEGIIQLSTVQHELITISNYIGVTVDVRGEYSDFFVAHVADGVVIVQTSGSLILPGSVTTVVLELHADNARAVLLLDVQLSEAPLLPTVTFSSPSYAVNVQIVQTGLVGRVSATADNGEAIIYSLAIDNAHLQARISINNVGELHLSAPANSGVYSFQVIATTAITQAEGRATIHFTVEAITICGDNEIVVPPLIILDRDEEEPHNNLVTLSQYENCQFTLTNRWPLNQNWLYVDGNGLHARSIDREHESIAHMAQSQVQVELILHCENDNVSRTKRSLRTDWLGPYDYGSNEWILTESISYNSRRSFVNLIVNDINDNYPIFVGKEREPIVVGYPNAELEGRILPRSLAELQATDADIGENAALRYWSSEDVLTVAPTTGFVHVRTGARLENDQRLTINATDQNGQGLTGSIQLEVKLLDLNNIVVITVRNAFLHDESTVLTQLSEAIGYEIKVLKSVVVSNDFDEDDGNILRKKREAEFSGPSLLLYVYGLLQSEPVSVDRLTTDINTNAATVSVINTVSLEDHLEPDEIIISENSIGLLVSTIVLGVLLFILLVLIGIWFFLKWRKNRNYETFSDANSLASRTDSVDQLPKLETPKPRLNIEDLKRSERRLQDMLNAPIEEVTIEAIPPRNEPPVESIVDLLSPESKIPIVIQSIDKLKSSEESDDDEFGEKPATRRKSVVTFNENVEKIIHVEDDPLETASSTSGYEIYKL